MAPLGYRFGDFRLAPAARELWLDERLVALPPKSLDCLIYLVEHRDRAVGRDELISAVWGRTEVSDDVLAQTLLRARRAVGDTGNDQRAIRTVPRFGYRWVQPVEEIVAPGGTPTAAISPEPAPREPEHRNASRRRILAIVAALVVVAAAALVWWSRASRVVAASGDDHAVLVLPVDVSGGDRESSWIRLGAMDYIASSLRERTPLKVVPSEQTLLVAGNGADPADAGTLHRIEVATGTRYVLAPHATYSGGAWSIVLDAYHHDGVQSYEARATSPLDAANLAVTRFVATLGVRVAPPAATTAATELVQRMDAAMLAGDLAEAHRLVETTPDALKNDPAVRVRTGQIAFRAGQLDAAAALFQPLAADASLAADLRAQAQMGLGAVAVRRADFETAEREYSASIDTLSGARDDPNLLGTAYSGRGVANGARGIAADALADLGRARVEFERAGNRIGEGTLEVNRALVELRRSRFAESAAAFDNAITIFDRFDVRDDLTAALIGKANLQLTTLDRAGALETSARAAKLAEPLENPILKRHVLALRVHALIASGALTTAARLLDDLGAGADGKPDVETMRALLAIERGDGAAASRLIASALDNGGASGAIPLAEPTLIAAIALRRGGDAATLASALKHLGAPGARTGEGSEWIGEMAAGELAAAREQDATPHFDAALAAADRLGAPDAIVPATIAKLAWLLGRRDFDGAKMLVGRLSAYGDRDYDSARAIAAFYRASGDADQARGAEANVRRLAGERNPALPI
jgi:DNA-binding winged helix-turn-helix (wHTH) protein/tetratricopeptide (TPR) repeat protein